MTFALVRPASAAAWELRGAWATGRRVALAIDADVVRVEGFVSSVSATGAYTIVDGLHIPIERILAVYRPSRLGDSSAVEGEPWLGPIPRALRDRVPGQGELDLEETR